MALLSTASRAGLVPAPLTPRIRAGAPAPRFPEPLATSTAVRPLVAGAGQPGEVLAALPHAVYVRVGADVVAVLASDAVRLPLGAVLGLPAARARLAELAGRDAYVGAGIVRIGDRAFRTSRWWAPPRPRLSAGPALRAAVRGLDAGLADVEVDVACRPAVTALERALSWGAYVPLAHAVAELVGRGPGLTPTGDDVLAGALATLRALGAAGAADQLACAVERRLTRTTALSAALLRHAGAGDVVPAAAGVITALGAPGDLSSALGPLLAVGGSSGGDLATGILVAARAVLAHEAREAVHG